MNVGAGNNALGLRKSFALFVVAATVGFVIDAGVVTLLVRWLAWGPWQGRFVSFPLAVTATWGTAGSGFLFITEY